MPRFNRVWRETLCGIFLLGGAAGRSHALPAFPGAEGWAVETPGGRGSNPSSNPPKVMIVTNTNANGSGSFMAALMTQGPRIIVFNTSGVIRLDASYNDFEPNGPYSFVTVAGQTSPGGVTFTGYMGDPGAGHGSIYWCYAACASSPFHDGVFRFLRFRADENNEDAVSFSHAHDFIFDHCDFSGASDETTDFTHSAHFTLQWNAVTNSSLCSDEDGGPDCQTYGTLIAYKEAEKISLHHNLWAHHKNRGGPFMHWDGEGASPDNGGYVDYVNNVSYDISQSGFYTQYGETYAKPVNVNVVGNAVIWGPNGRTRNVISLDGISVYNRDNMTEEMNGARSVLGAGSIGSTIDVSSPWEMPDVTTTPADENIDTVLGKVGAWPRDPMNVRTIRDVRNKTGIIGKTDDDMITSGFSAPLDADKDGMPDAWEDAMLLDKAVAADNVQDKDGDGYLNIEEYINDLASARLCEDFQIQNKGAPEAAIREILTSWRETPPCSGNPPAPGLPSRPRRLRAR
jgi:hypothetical protein